MIFFEGWSTVALDLSSTRNGATESEHLTRTCTKRPRPKAQSEVKLYPHKSQGHPACSRSFPHMLCIPAFCGGDVERPHKKRRLCTRKNAKTVRRPCSPRASSFQTVRQKNLTPVRRCLGFLEMFIKHRIWKKFLSYNRSRGKIFPDFGSYPKKKRKRIKRRNIGIGTQPSMAHAFTSTSEFNITNGPKTIIRGSNFCRCSQHQITSLYANPPSAPSSSKKSAPQLAALIRDRIIAAQKRLEQVSITLREEQAQGNK